MRSFLVIWSGQFVSLVGTAMTNFALMVWAWELTGEATALALLGFFHMGAVIACAPFAGVIADRYDRKLVLALSDLVAGLATLVLLVLFFTGHLEIWHVYVTRIITGASQSVQFPTFSAVVTLLLDKEHYARASGMMSMAQDASAIFAPAATGFLLVWVDLGTIMVIDLVTFAVAITLLLTARIAQPPRSAAGQEAGGGLFREALFGIRYIVAQRSLLMLQLVFTCSNFLGVIALALRAPMILAKTGNDEVLLGSVMSALGVGGLAGGLLLTVWGGPKPRIHGVLLGITVTALASDLVMGLGNSLPVWMAATFAFTFFITVVNGSNQAIWQAKIPPDIQGRVFASRLFIAQVSSPIAMLLAGPLADRVMEPAMSPGGALAETFGGLVGTGPGSGMALVFVATGLLGSLVGVGGYAVRALRRIETELPDHDAAHQED